MKKLSDDLWQATMLVRLSADDEEFHSVEGIVRICKEKILGVREMPGEYAGFLSVLTDDDFEFVIKSSLMNFYIEVLQEPLTAATPKARKKVPGGSHV